MVLVAAGPWRFSLSELNAQQTPPSGAGAEAVIPLNERGISILAKALRMAIGGAGASYNMNVYTQNAASPIREFGLMQAMAGAQ